MTTNRRSFIQNSLTATAGLGIISSFPGGLQAAQKIVAPSDQINIALIGCRSMGFGDLKNHLNIPGVNCIGLCDIDQNVLNDKAAEIQKTYNQKPQLYGDYRKLSNPGRKQSREYFIHQLRGRQGRKGVLEFQVSGCLR